MDFRNILPKFTSNDLNILVYQDRFFTLLWYLLQNGQSMTPRCWVTIVSRVGQINTLITMTVVCMWPRSWRFVGLRASFRRLEMSFVKNRDHANIITTIIFMVRDRTIIRFVGCVITYWIGKLLGRLLLLKYYVIWRTTTWGLLSYCCV